jgi:hypothetical protein
LTTVLSMNAMLDPRIVAARTHVRDFSAQGTPGDPALISTSSHGCFISNLDAFGLQRDSGLYAIGSLATSDVG